jgi:hypothetical protein
VASIGRNWPSGGIERTAPGAHGYGASTKASAGLEGRALPAGYQRSAEVAEFLAERLPPSDERVRWLVSFDCPRCGIERPARDRPCPHCAGPPDDPPPVLHRGRRTGLTSWGNLPAC